MSETDATDFEKKGFDWRIAFWILFIGLVIADQAIKAWARHALVERQSITLIPRAFELMLTYNKGIAFGMFQGAGTLLAPIAIAIAGGATYYSMRHRRESPFIHIAMALLAAGAMGNLYDRLFLHQVTDMFHITAFEFPIFNLADSCITIAACILILRWGSEWFVDGRKDKEPAGPNAQDRAPTETVPGEIQSLP